jgi:hypothetical protein
MVCRVCVAAILMSSASVGALAAGIGTVVDVVNQGYRTPPGASELPAKPTDQLVQGEGLRTGSESTIQVKFIDGSELSIESESEVLLSDYVFDSGGGASAGSIQLGEGLFHFNSNGVADGGVKLETPVATIGIRGTEFLVTVAKGVTVVDIVDGEVELKPRGGGKAVTCEGGQSILASGSDDDAVCGDFGSFSTAAGVPSSTTPAAGKVGDGIGGGGGVSGDHGGGKGGGGSSGGGGDSGGGDNGGGDNGGGDNGGGDNGGGDNGGGDNGGGGDTGKDNHSGLGDGTNPGKGHGNGNGNGNGNGQGGGGNGGSNNPGGGKK